MTTIMPAPASKPMTRRELEARIIAKAWKDPAYKQRLTSDPKGVLQEELHAIDPSIKLPDALQVQMHEENANLFHLVMPRNPNDIKLSEVMGDNLEAVAPQTIAVVVVGVVGGAAIVSVTASATINANITFNVNAVA
jgi:hypothetical protein